MNLKGIDISKHNKTADFSVAKAHIDFAILRAGYGREISQKDPCFETFYANAKANCMPVGAYWYSYAESIEDARKEAATFLEAIKGKQFEYPVYFDIEENSQATKGKDFCTEICIAFCEVLENAGYFAGIYANTNWWSNYLDQNKLSGYTRWLADYRENYNTTIPRDIHQYSSKGSVAGIGLASGGLDMNTCTRDFPTEIKAGGYNGYSKGTTVESSVTTVSNTATTPHWKGTVVCDTLSLRKTASTGAASLRTLKKGEYFTVIEMTSGWCYIDFAGIKGYVIADDAYLTVEDLNGTQPNMTFGYPHSKATAATTSTTAIYTVVKGDTLSAIASKYGTTYKKLAELNGIADPNKISVGQVIKIK